MPNIKGFKPLTDPSWISIEFDDGTISNPVNDPSGEYRAQVDQIAKKIKGTPPDPMANATASLGGELAEGAGTAMSKADVTSPLQVAPRADATFTPTPAPAAPAADAGGGNVGRILGKYAAKPQPEGGMPEGGGQPQQRPGAAPPMPPKPPGVPAPGPMQVTGTTSTWQRQKGDQTSTSGIAEGDRPKVEATQEASFKATEESNDANFVAKANQLWDEWGRYSQEAKQRLAEKSVAEEQERQFDQKVQAAHQKYDEDARRPMDPSKAFAGEKRWYAVMAAFGDVLRNIGSALAGQRPVADPGATLDGIVERELNLQMAQKEEDLKAGRISIDRYTAERETARHKIGIALSQYAQAELGRAQSKQAYQALGALKKGADATVADARAKGAQALARQETKSTSDTQVSGGSTQRERVPTGGGASLDQISKILDIEKKQLELRNAQLDAATVDDVSGAIGKNVSPERAKQLRDTVKENAVPLAKLSSFMNGIKQQLTINGATVDWNTGKVVWPKDLSGVSAIKPSDVLGHSVGEALNTSEDQLRRQQAFNKELLTTDTTGAVATPEQGDTFNLVLGGAGRNEDAYKAAVESTVKYLVARRHGFLTAMGEDGANLYKATENKMKNAQAAKMNEIGNLPEGRR